MPTLWGQMRSSEGRGRRARLDLCPARIADKIDLERNVRALCRYFRQYRASRRHDLHPAARYGVYDEVLLSRLGMVCHAAGESRFGPCFGALMCA